jgi:hypothetical protein
MLVLNGRGSRHLLLLEAQAIRWQAGPCDSSSRTTDANPYIDQEKPDAARYDMPRMGGVMSSRVNEMTSLRMTQAWLEI